MVSKAAEVLVIGARGIPNVEGGAEKNAEKLFPRLVNKGYSVTLLGLSTYIKADSFQGVRLLSAPSVWLLNTDKLFYYLAAIVYAVRLRPRIVHLQGLGAAMFLWVYKLLGFIVVVRYGSADYLVPKWGVFGQLGFRASEFQLRFADAVVSVASSLTRRLKERGIEARVHTIPNALDVPDQPWQGSASPTQRPYLLVVGRVTSQKNIDTVLRAFALLSRERPDCELVIAGSLNDKKYAEMLQPLVIEGVTMPGAVSRDRVAELLRGCALYVNISHHEGNSNATLEAISHGCPVLVSDIPENREMQLSPNNFVDQNDIEAVARAFAAGLASPRDFIVDQSGFLSWDDIAQQTAQVYASLLKG